jgi:hypothetical protein
MKHAKPFILGCLITAFAVSLGVNYMYYKGTFQTVQVEQTDDQRLASVLGAL